MEYHFPLINREDVAEGTTAFALDTTGTDFTYKAGQNADFTLTNPIYTDGEGNTRTFSLVTSPTEENRIMFTTRMRDTAFKNTLKELPLGTKITVSQAMGRFTLPKDETKPVLFLAGGIGITPYMSMLQYVAAEKLEHNITLLYSNRTLALTAFYDKLLTLKEQLPHFAFVPTFTDDAPADWRGERGPIDEAMIRRYANDINKTIFYVAGPVPMAQAMVGLLETMDIPEEHIKVEDFPGY